jgi:putative ABC transport system ATP-binding protein
MRTWTATTTVEAPPQAVLDVLTDPEACARWAPVDFAVDDLAEARLTAGSTPRLRGRIAGREVGFDVEVLEASDGRLALRAAGPVALDVAYELQAAACGRRSEVRASIGVRPGRGLTGRLVAEATSALLRAARPAPGALPDRPGVRAHVRLGGTLSATLTPATTATDVAVAATAVTRTYGGGDAAVHALRGVSLEVPAGQFTAIMGPSGSGKSTLMHLLAGLDRPTDGTVHIGGEDVTRMSDAQLTKLRRRHVGFVFQAFNLLPVLTAEENVVLPLTVAGRKADPEVLDRLLVRLGLDERRTHKPSQLSGGQQQRVAIARSLIAQPTVLLADEPTGNLDSRAGAEVLAMLREAVELDGQTIVMVTHDPRAAEAADRVVHLADGRIVEDVAR